MRRTVWMPGLVGAVLVVLSTAAVLWSADAPAPAEAAKEAAKSDAAPAKSEPAKPEAAPAKPAPTANGKKKPEPADNSYCYACHVNYQSEKLTKVHQKAGVGCEKCHGLSVKHSGDEDNITPPDKMYPKAEINGYCQTCHAKETLLKRDEHRDFFKEAAEGETCTDCHGEKHRLKVRTRHWDKKTGQLLKDDGVRMMEKMKK